ncbi:aspartate aminotransferase family protein [Lichenifustis flavocetrariae]|uniref:Aspartate aminotransferase family protein n=1 Tax=Lichenifustis flavocetrariae TaxID=2949735 RepID=A0AA41Z2W3_9HYPH|nr:aspartate aminotransferase family protein [Lichenifustis flavocetrariae]MCW6511977.1 aspartate aminotransferase family protein [Lichenifustis flavocetrariae]
MTTRMVNGFDPSQAGKLPNAEAALIARRQRLLGPAYRLFYEHPVHPVRGEGVWLYDRDGTRYLDVYNNVPVVGHCHPRVVEAIARQAARLNTHTRYLHESILDYAEALLATVPRELGHVMFTCTGSEANDLAVRVAKASTNGTAFIVTANAYHGVTDAVAALSPLLGPSNTSTLNVFTVPAPDQRLACNLGVETAFAAGVQAALDSIAAQGLKPAALMVDTIFSSDGVFADPPGFLRTAVNQVRQAGGLFIADEVQAGFGRLGDGLWGFSRHGLVPDLVTMGKPMGNGHPVAAMLARPVLLERFGMATRYFNTFGGNPVSIAAAQAVLDVIAEEGLVENARAVGLYLREALIARAEADERLGSVRGSGLFIGVDVNPASGSSGAAQAARIVNGLRERHVLISASGPAGDVLKIRPPLPFGRDEADYFLATLDDVMRTLEQ